MWLLSITSTTRASALRWWDSWSRLEQRKHLKPTARSWCSKTRSGTLFKQTRGWVSVFWRRIYPLKYRVDIHCTFTWIHVRFCFYLFCIYDISTIINCRKFWWTFESALLRNRYFLGLAELIVGGLKTGIKDLRIVFDSASTYTYFVPQAFKAIVNWVREIILDLFG